MKTAVEKLSATRVKLNVEVPFEELKPAIDQAARKIAQDVQLPGFRKGKVPTALVEQRFGKATIIQEAVNDALPGFYSQAAAEAEIKPAGRPEVDVTEVPGLDGSEGGALVFVVEQDVRPEIALPDFAGLEVEIEEPTVDDDAVDVRLTQLRERFGTLKGVDRPAKDGDFVSLDMVAKIDDDEVDTVEGVSYHIGEGNMLEGLDEALIGLSADESTTFTSVLAGGERAGEDAQITVTAKSVKERELPEADDEFAEMASEFDTIDELKADLKAQAQKDAEHNLAHLARNALLEKLLADLDIEVPEQLVTDEVTAHLENENKPADDPHGEEIKADTIKAIQAQFLLDAILDSREVEVGQEDLMAYISQLAGQYGMDPNTFIQAIAQGGQLEEIFSEVRRSKALDSVLAEVTVKAVGSGEVLDLGLSAAADADEAEGADDKAEKKPAAKKAPAKKAAEKKPAAKKAPAKKAPAKKAESSEDAS
ncbi:MAG: trigger factor [Dermabacter sp.]|nr:trigger factor [Dermabacter sp.]